MALKDQRERAKRVKRHKAPRYQAVSQVLRQQMKDGQLAPGVKLPALRDLAQRFKVSTNTIRYALRALEREGCVYHVPDVGAFVHPSYAVKSKTAVTIALSTIDIGGAFELGIARGIEYACHQRGWGLQIYDARADAGREASNLAHLKQTATQGAIVMPINDHANLEALVELKLSGYPIILVDRGMPGLKVDLVESAHEAGAFLATRHLLDQGYSRVYMVSFPPFASSIADRIQGFERAFIEHGQEPSRHALIWADTEVSARGVREGKRWLEGYEAILPLLKDWHGPVGIFALNDYLGWGVYQACRELKLRIPEDVSVICFDDSDLTRAVSPPMTVIAQRPAEIGQKAVELLERRLQATDQTQLPPERITVGVDLIERQSVARAAP
jgi:DNA-binding LacI/PurR family transcriptional regulator